MMLQQLALAARERTDGRGLVQPYCARARCMFAVNRAYKQRVQRFLAPLDSTGQLSECSRGLQRRFCALSAASSTEREPVWEGIENGHACKKGSSARTCCYLAVSLDSCYLPAACITSDGPGRLGTIISRVWQTRAAHGNVDPENL